MEAGNTMEIERTLGQERRAERRFPLRLSIHVKCFSDVITEATSFTRDVSALGASFFLDFALREGAHVEMIITLPSEVTLSEEIRVRCKGRVVRVGHSPFTNKIGIATVIEQYDFTAQ